MEQTQRYIVRSNFGMEQTQRNIFAGVKEHQRVLEVNSEWQRHKAKLAVVNLLWKVTYVFRQE